MKFVVDCMLGKLAKWLKILGFDAFYDAAADDDRLLAVAQQERRALLSRDQELLARAEKLPRLAVESESWPDQVEQVLDAFNLWTKTAPFSRCLGCNVRLKPLCRESARNLVSSYVLEKSREFAICPSCGRVFWQGTHYRAMEERLSKWTRRGGREPKAGRCV